MSSVISSSSGNSSRTNTCLVFVGSYTQPAGHVPSGCGDGVTVLAFDLEEGLLTWRSHADSNNSSEPQQDTLHNPTYMYYDPSTDVLYAVEEVCSAEDPHQARVVAYQVLVDSFQLKKISQIIVPRIANCYAMRHENSLLVPSYGSGSLLSIPLEAPTGNLGDSYSEVKYQGSGPNEKRQEAAHAHHVAVEPHTGNIWVCDLGSDTVWCHSKDLVVDLESSIKTPPGSGPRHLLYHPVYPKLYVVAELTGILLEYTKVQGKWILTSETDTYVRDYPGVPSGAAIRLHPSHKALYVSCRNHNSIAILKLEDGHVVGRHPKLWIPTGGDCPRDFNIDPTGQWLMIANQNTHSLVVYRINPKDGLSVDIASKRQFPCKSPACIVFGQSQVA